MDIKIGGKIAALRRQKGLTQDQLADQLGVSAPAVSSVSTFVPNARARGHSSVISGYELSVSHLLTAGAETPS